MFKIRMIEIPNWMDGEALSRFEIWILTFGFIYSAALRQSLRSCRISIFEFRIFH